MSVEYSEEFLNWLTYSWGEGFLSPGGREEVATIVEGIDLHGKTVLDIGCGLGEPALLLAAEHQAARVIGIDVQSHLVAQANSRAREKGLQDRVAFQTVQPGALPFPDDTFDLVFSKDSIIYVADKPGFFAEVARVAKPGGRLAVSDWFCGGDVFSPEMEGWLAAAGPSFVLAPMRDCALLCREAGLTEIESRDRNAWYVRVASADLAQLRGPGWPAFRAAAGEAGAADWLNRCEKRLTVARQGHLRPGHIRARKPHGVGSCNEYRPDQPKTRRLGLALGG